MAKKSATEWEPKDWQKDPMQVTTPQVQYWTRSGVMLTAQMPLEVAREKVRNGHAFIITHQAIGEFSDTPYGYYSE
ncbi:MAG TPA: hypothetical protein VJN91_06055 [Gammaproteobacteria bacterium]|nr:hypothetical protein [Gammaproteobacteria bacterium]